MNDWPIHPHSELKRISNSVYLVEGSIPKFPLKRSMTIARTSGGLFVHNAIACDESTMSEIDALGEVKAIVVPSALHRYDADRFVKRYKGAKIYAPEGALQAVQKKVSREVFSYEKFQAHEDSDNVQLVHLEGTKKREGVALISDHETLSLVFNDVLFNHPHVNSLGGLVMRVLAATGGPKVDIGAKLLLVNDKRALQKHLRELSAMRHLKHIVPGHGDVISDRAAEVLMKVADRY